MLEGEILEKLRFFKEAEENVKDSYDKIIKNYENEPFIEDIIAIRDCEIEHAELARKLIERLESLG